MAKYTCIICPNSCQIEYTKKSISGNKCKRGEKFVIQEAKAPLRTLTTSIKCLTSDKMIAVKSKEPIPLSKFDKCMKIIKTIELKKVPKIGKKIKKKEFPKYLTLIVTN